MIRYVADFDHKKPSVNAVECAPGAAPDGVADNYVFDTEGEAWERVAREFEAGLALGTRQRRDLLAKIRAVEEEIAQDAEALVAVHKEMEKRGFRS